MRLSVIIPSKNVDNLVPCIKAVIACEPKAEILVIDDGLPRNPWLPEEAYLQGGPIFVLGGTKPFVFARNINIGIHTACENDVVLLNDDAILEEPHGFSIMQQAAAQEPTVGLISSATNYAGNPAQLRHPQLKAEWRLRFPGITSGNSFCTVAFVCVFIPRRTINAVGLLDERFTAYGWEDNDYCRRVVNAGLRIGVHDGCFVDHSKLKSSYRGGPAVGGQLSEGRRIYMEKWGTI